MNDKEKVLDQQFWQWMDHNERLDKHVKQQLLDIHAFLMRPQAFRFDKEYGNQAALRDLLAHAICNSSYYSAISKGSSIKEFPVVNKTILKAHYEEVLIPQAEQQALHTVATSGSTGIPFSVYQDGNKRARHLADLKYFGFLAGYQDQDPMCNFKVKPTATLEEQKQCNVWQLDICSLNEDSLTKHYAFITSSQCKALMGYPSTLITATEFWRKHFPNETKVSTIITIAEALTDEERNVLRKYWGSTCKIVSRYSNSEQGILGQEDTEKHVFHMNWASYYFEILKLDRDVDADEGELGRVVVTDLFNKAFPLIRYDTGDVARMVRGMGTFPAITDLYGRKIDLIYDTKGEVVSPFLISRFLKYVKEIEQWQFIQEKKKVYRLLITVTNGRKPDLVKETRLIKEALGADAILMVDYVHEIPKLSSLKRKLIVSNLIP